MAVTSTLNANFIIHNFYQKIINCQKQIFYIAPKISTGVHLSLTLLTSPTVDCRPTTVHCPSINFSVHMNSTKILEIVKKGDFTLCPKLSQAFIDLCHYLHRPTVGLPQYTVCLWSSVFA